MSCCQNDCCRFVDCQNLECHPVGESLVELGLGLPSRSPRTAPVSELCAAIEGDRAWGDLGRILGLHSWSVQWGSYIPVKLKLVCFEKASLATRFASHAGRAACVTTPPKPVAKDYTTLLTSSTRLKLPPLRDTICSTTAPSSLTLLKLLTFQLTPAFNGLELAHYKRTRKVNGS